MIFAFSFAGEDRKYVHEVAKKLKLSKLSALYDGSKENKLCDKDLAIYLYASDKPIF
jgi:hypothetical protein